MKTARAPGRLNAGFMFVAGAIKSFGCESYATVIPVKSEEQLNPKGMILAIVVRVEAAARLL